MVPSGSSESRSRVAKRAVCERAPCLAYRVDARQGERRSKWVSLRFSIVSRCRSEWHSLPWPLRVVCGYVRAVCADVVKAFEKDVIRSLRHRAKSCPVQAGEPFAGGRQNARTCSSENVVTSAALPPGMTVMKTASLASLVLLAAGMLGCQVATEESLEIGTQTQSLCDTNAESYPVLATLAVAMASKSGASNP